MKRTIVSIKDGDQVLLESAEALISEGNSGGIRTWSGSLNLPRGHHLEVGATISLATADGRSGNIVIRRAITGADGRTRVEFKGTGPLK